MKVTETEAAVAAAGPGSSRIMALVDGSTSSVAGAFGGSTATLLPGSVGCTVRSLAGVESEATLHEYWRRPRSREVSA